MRGTCARAKGDGSEVELFREGGEAALSYGQLVAKDGADYIIPLSSVKLAASVVAGQHSRGYLRRKAG